MKSLLESNDHLQLNFDGNDMIQQGAEFHTSKYKYIFMMNNPLMAKKVSKDIAKQII